jgi:hypothetical protein
MNDIVEDDDYELTYHDIEYSDYNLDEDEL